MEHFKNITAELKKRRGGLGKLVIASWLLTNTMWLLTSQVPFVTLDFVRQISMRNFLGIWAGIYGCMAFLYLVPPGSRNMRFLLAPSVAVYLAVLMLKGTVA